MWNVSNLQSVNLPPKLSSTHPSGIAFFKWHKPILSKETKNKDVNSETKSWLQKSHNAINLINNRKLILLNIKEMLVLKLGKFSIHLSGNQGGLGNFIHLSYNIGIEKFINRLSLYSKILLLKCLIWCNHDLSTNLLFLNKNMWIKTEVIWNRALFNG